MSKVALGEICEILNGYAFKSDKYVDSGVRVIRITNVQKGYVEDEKPQFYSEEDMQNLQEYLLTEGDLLMSLTGNVGRVALLRKEFLPAALNQRVSCLRNKSNKVNMKYVYYALLTQKFEDDCIASAKGIAQKNMSTEWLKQYTIELPEVDKQEEIVQICDKLSTIVEERRQQLLELDNLIKSRFVELFGNPDINEQKWEICKLEALCDVGSSKRIYQSEQSLTGIPFLRISDLVNRMDNGSLDCDLFIPETRYEELKEQGLVPQSGDILLTARGTLGRCYIVKEDDEFYFQDGMITWLSNYDSRVTPLYISYLFEMPGFRKQVDALQAGSTVAYLSIAMAKKLDVMVPSMDAQNQFADFVKQVDKLKFLLIISQRIYKEGGNRFGNKF